MYPLTKNYNQLARVIITSFCLVVIFLIPYDILFGETNIVCVHKYLFGFQCPLCGMTRAVYQFIHFRIYSALSYNVVVVLLPIYFGMDITSLFLHESWLISAKRIVVATIIVAFLLLYAFRIYKYIYGL